MSTVDIFDSDSFFYCLLADVRGLLRCGVTPGLLIPRFDGVIHMRVWEEHPWTGSSWQRHDHAWRRGSKTANASVACTGNRKRGIDWKTVAKWHKCDKVEDTKRGRREPRTMSSRRPRWRWSWPSEGISCCRRITLLACAARGRLARQTEDQGDDPLRPGIAVHRPRVAGVPQPAHSVRKHQPPRQLPRSSHGAIG